MHIARFETFLANAGLRNYLFIRLTTDTGLTGIGEATLEWQELAVQTLLNDWVQPRVLGADPFEIERVIGDLVRDQYQGGSTVMTAISGVEIAFWDLIGKQCGQPIYRLLGGRVHERLPAYANGWYGGAQTPQDYARKARDVVARGYHGMKFDPLGTAWKEMTPTAMRDAEAIVAAIREEVGETIELMFEVHGRLSVNASIELAKLLEPYRLSWYEEPVTPNSLDLLLAAKQKISIPIAAGERLYTLEDFYRLTQMRACDVLQPDLAHCGGLWAGKKIAAMAQAQDILVSPHCSIGPVAFCAALHFDWSTPNVRIQENFADYDVPWRDELVHGWNGCREGECVLPEGPGLGIELNVEACARHPYQQGSFPSLWDARWVREFTKKLAPEK